MGGFFVYLGSILGMGPIGLDPLAGKHYILNTNFFLYIAIIRHHTIYCTFDLRRVLRQSMINGAAFKWDR